MDESDDRRSGCSNSVEKVKAVFCREGDAIEGNDGKFGNALLIGKC